MLVRSQYVEHCRTIFFDRNHCRTLILLVCDCVVTYNFQATSVGRDVAAVINHDKPRVCSVSSKITEVMKRLSSYFVICIVAVYSFLVQLAYEYRGVGKVSSVLFRVVENMFALGLQHNQCNYIIFCCRTHMTHARAAFKNQFILITYSIYNNHLISGHSTPYSFKGPFKLKPGK